MGARGAIDGRDTIQGDFDPRIVAFRPYDSSLRLALRHNPRAIDTINELEASASTGALQGFLGIRNASAELGSLANNGVGLAARRTGMMSPERSRQLTQRLEDMRRLGGPGILGFSPRTYEEDLEQQPTWLRDALIYHPHTEAGRITQTAAGFASGAVLPGSATTRVLTVVLPAIASEGAGQATRRIDPELEPYARPFAAFLAAGGARIRFRPTVPEPVRVDAPAVPEITFPPELERSMHSIIDRRLPPAHGDEPAWVHGAHVTMHFPQQQQSEASGARGAQTLTPLPNQGSVVQPTVGHPVEAPEPALFAPQPEVFNYPDGTFSIHDWRGYPSRIPAPLPGYAFMRIPPGQFRRVTGGALRTERSAGGRANRAFRREYLQTYRGQITRPFDVHHIKPLALGGVPDDEQNLIPLERQFHRSVHRDFWAPYMRIPAQ